MENDPTRPPQPPAMNAYELNWQSMNRLPEAGTTVLIHVPHDDEPVWFGFWDGRRWHYIEGLPVRSEVKHWCGVPHPPEVDWIPVPAQTDFSAVPVAPLVGADLA